MAKRRFRLELKSGKDNIREFPEKASQTFKRGQLLKISGSTPGSAALLSATGGVSTAVLGVAAKDGQNAATPSDNVPVYVVTPEQVWELHAKSGKKPTTAYTIGKNYKIALTSTASFVMTPEDKSSTTKVSVAGPVLSTSSASAGQGVVLVGYRAGGKKGSKVLVRFAPGATITE